MGEISIGKLLIVGLIFVLLFGTKKLRTLGSDLGYALKGFQNAVKDEPIKAAAAIEKKTKETTR
ncbi:twin-arginine translocase TatA/TatE family subunit [Photobacterium leiognathi]|uniref:twin-arginine translocase TatA/TatE family subunit n=1 Tax=Photobacterium leiognathi TaxID=553611 RepID=UPI002981C148|nr:twin-arginine translocase TatA/TatE family subunit [Photobacterium leiognathi]